MNTRSEQGGKISKGWKSRIIFLALLALLSCGGKEEETWVVVPNGPTPISPNGTIQFTSTKPDVIWIVIGGDVNGSIDAFGLYTAPAVLPPDPLVTILTQDGDQQVFAFVQLTP